MSMARPDGPGSHPSDQTPSGSGGKAVSIPRDARRPLPDVAIADYLSAYREANGCGPNFRLIYENGWVQFRSKQSSWVIDRKRTRELVEMIGRLREKAALGPRKWSCDFRSAPQDQDVLAGCYTKHGTWRQAVVRYCAEIVWDWPFGESPTHWRRIAPPPPQGIEARSAETLGSAEGKSPVVEDDAPSREAAIKSKSTEESAA